MQIKRTDGFDLACSFHSWLASGLDQRLLSRIRDIIAQPGAGSRSIFVTGAL